MNAFFFCVIFILLKNRDESMKHTQKHASESLLTYINPRSILDYESVLAINLLLLRMLFAGSKLMILKRWNAIYSIVCLNMWDKLSFISFSLSIYYANGFSNPRNSCYSRSPECPSKLSFCDSAFTFSIELKCCFWNCLLWVRW